jgi:hypothetical protein
MFPPDEAEGGVHAVPGDEKTASRGENTRISEVPQRVYSQPLARRTSCPADRRRTPKRLLLIFSSTKILETWRVAAICSGACDAGALLARHEEFYPIPCSLTVSCHQVVYEVKW